MSLPPIPPRAPGTHYVEPCPSLPLGGWVGFFPDGSHTIDFGLEREAEACRAYFEGVIERCNARRAGAPTTNTTTTHTTGKATP